MTTEGWILLILIIFFILFIIFCVLAALYAYNLSQKINEANDKINLFTQYIPALEDWICSISNAFPFCKK